MRPWLCVCCLFDIACLVRRIVFLLLLAVPTQPSKSIGLVRPDLPLFRLPPSPPFPVGCGYEVKQRVGHQESHAQDDEAEKKITNHGSFLLSRQIPPPIYPASRSIQEFPGRCTLDSKKYNPRL